MTYMARPGIPKEAFILTSNDIIEDVANFYKIPPNKIKERTRVRKYLNPRQLAMCILRIKMPRRSLRWIGLQFGGFDHSTVLHSIRQVSDALEVDEEYRDEVLPFLQSHGIKAVDVFKLVKERK